MNALDRIIGYFAPATALDRAKHRRILSYYEAGRLDVQRKQRKETGSANTAVRNAGHSLREQARHLDQNHDLSKGILNTLVANVIGPQGIMVEPQPRTFSGAIHEPTAKMIKDLRADWNRKPEVTWRHDWPAAERLAGRTWLRDGEVLGQHIEGIIPSLDHGTRVPYSVEFLEPDFLPMDFDDSGRGIIQGCETNSWGRVVAYHIYLRHPGDAYLSFRAIPGVAKKRVPARNVMHIALCERLHQLRGVSVFAPVMLRLDDVKDYEESERIAAKVAASMAAAIIKGSPEQYEQATDEDGNLIERDMRMRAGAIFDNLMPGEKIEPIDTKRPNSGLESFRRGQLRAVASGVYCTYSSLAKDYDGTYSSQRQELVEGFGTYGILQSEWIGKCSRPVHERFIAAALGAGQLVLSPDVDPQTLTDAMYIAPQMPWIDPIKEANAWEKLERNGHASGPEIIRKRGRDPSELYEQEILWRDKWTNGGHVISTDPASDAGLQQVDTNESDEQEDDQSPQGRVRLSRSR